LSNRCKWLHDKLEELPLIKYPFEVRLLPKSGIYFFYEGGEFWGHGGNALRIVRIGTHKKDNFRNRVAEHFLFDEVKKMNFNKDKPKPSDRSIFRKNIGRALLNRDKDPYLRIWEIDFMLKQNRRRFGHLRNIEKEKQVERRITEILRERFSFRFIIVEDENTRIGETGLESRLIGTVSNCKYCRLSANWLGNSSPKEQIRISGLWLVQHLNASEINEQDMYIIENAVQKTRDYMRSVMNVAKR